MMVKGIDAAVSELKRDPDHAVTAEIDGLVVELRLKGRRTADDVFREAGLWQGDSAEEISRIISEARERGGAKEPPAF